MLSAAMEPPIVELVSTAAAEPVYRFDLWREQVRRTCGTLQVLGDQATFVGGSIATSSLGAVRVSLISAGPHTVIREERIASREGGHVYVAAPLRGTSRLAQDGIDVTVQTGDIVSFDSSRSYTLTMLEPFEMLALRTTHRALGLSPESTKYLTAKPWTGSSGIGALASRTFAALGRHVTELEEAVRESLGTTIGGLISTLFAERLQSCAVDPAVARQLLLLKITSFAKEHLGNYSLSPTTMARHHNISLRYLQMLFAEQGMSPAKWIRDERLSRLGHDLTDPRYQHMTVAAIGERWGLFGASQVSRLFRREYGLTPSEYRRLRQRVEA